MASASVNDPPRTALSSGDSAPQTSASRRVAAHSVAPWHVGRTLCEAAVFAAVAWLLVRCWLVEPFTINGSSMAETLLASHVWIDCPDCDYRFAAGVEGPASADRPAVCPNCGCAEAHVELDSAAGGDGVFLFKRLLAARTPRRWDVIACRAPNEAHLLCVKRVAGLPGESISIVEGDVYADGQLQRKTLSQQRALAIPVHDDRFRPKSSQRRSCWQAEPDSQWRAATDGFEYTAESRRTAADGGEPSGSFNSHPAFAELDWLAYHHARRTNGAGNVEESPVMDIYGYNQTFPVREVHVVRDLLLSCQVAASGAGALYLRAGDGASEFVCQVEADGGCKLWKQNEAVARGASARPLRGGLRQVELSLVDRCLLLAIDGETLVEYPFERESNDATTVSPFAIASVGLSLTVRDLLVMRDVYYGPAPGSTTVADSASPCQLAADEYFLVSDNSPLGKDSRTVTFGPAVPSKLLVGKPFVAYGKRSAAAASWLWIQVPEVHQIRYIR